MNISESDSFAWSFTSDNEVALNTYVRNLRPCAEECIKQPSEIAAENACKAVRYVWDTAEGMIHANIEIDGDLLSKALEGINCCVQALTQMEKGQPGLRFKEHLRVMIAAMSERQYDLTILATEGKAGFKRRLNRKSVLIV